MDEQPVTVGAETRQLEQAAFRAVREAEGMDSPMNPSPQEEKKS